MRPFGAPALPFLRQPPLGAPDTLPQKERFSSHAADNKSAAAAGATADKSAAAAGATADKSAAAAGATADKSAAAAGAIASLEVSAASAMEDSEGVQRRCCRGAKRLCRLPNERLSFTSKFRKPPSLESFCSTAWHPRLVIATAPSTEAAESQQRMQPRIEDSADKSATAGMQRHAPPIAEEEAAAKFSFAQPWGGGAAFAWAMAAAALAYPLSIEEAEGERLDVSRGGPLPSASEAAAARGGGPPTRQAVADASAFTMCSLLQLQELLPVLQQQEAQLQREELLLRQQGCEEGEFWSGFPEATPVLLQREGALPPPSAVVEENVRVAAALLELLRKRDREDASRRLRMMMTETLRLAEDRSVRSDSLAAALKNLLLLPLPEKSNYVAAAVAAARELEEALAAARLEVSEATETQLQTPGGSSPRRRRAAAAVQSTAASTDYEKALSSFAETTATAAAEGFACMPLPSREGSGMHAAEEEKSDLAAFARAAGEQQQRQMLPLSRISQVAEEEREAFLRLLAEIHGRLRVSRQIFAAATARHDVFRLQHEQQGSDRDAWGTSPLCESEVVLDAERLSADGRSLTSPVHLQAQQEAALWELQQLERSQRRVYWLQLEDHQKLLRHRTALQLQQHPSKAAVSGRDFSGIGAHATALGDARVSRGMPSETASRLLQEGDLSLPCRIIMRKGSL
ncbi:hypothetical protein cyc_06957 [Cyclospora cayetanensis]|uniref:Uncharacterized protein n=1 Tax=Cyclospora cayetanensis TaxID=88456 RepID=A0A1D3CUD8_9EIME|nr:hypothetical protein cyc_06957 [Cyclospora cayetanensis]